MRRLGRWRALVIITAAQIAVALVNQGVPTIAAFIEGDLRLSRPEVGLVGTGIYLGGLLAMAAVGWAADRYGERVVLGCGAILTGAVMLAVHAVTALLPLLAVLMLAGVGAAVATPAGAKAVMGWFGPEERGLAMGLRQTGIPLGGVLAALLLPAVAARLGWRDALTLAGLVTAAGGLMTLLLYREPAPASRAGQVSGTGRSAAPEARARAWRETLTPELAHISLAGMLMPIGQFALVTYLTLYLRERWGIPIVAGAAFLVLAQVAGTAGRVVWGAASDRVFGGRRRTALLWIAGCASVAALALAELPAGRPGWLLPAVICFFGFTALAWQGIFMALVAELAGPERAGSAVGIALTAVQIGIVVGAPLFGLLAQAAHAYGPAWLADAGVFAVALALLLRVPEGRRQPSLDGAA